MAYCEWQRLCCVRGHDDWVKCCAYRDGLLLTGGDDNTIRLWKMERMEGDRSTVDTDMHLREVQQQLSKLERQRRSSSCDGQSVVDSGIGESVISCGNAEKETFWTIAKWTMWQRFLKNQHVNWKMKLTIF